MRVLVVYYSRTGVTKKLALKLSKKFDADLCEITCPRYTLGVFSYFKAGYDSVTHRLPAITTSENIYHNYDLVLIGSPIWTSYPALPIRSFLDSQPALPENIGLFFSYGGHSLPEKAISHIEKTLGRPVTGALAIQNKIVRQDAYDNQLNNYVRKLKDQAKNTNTRSSAVPSLIN